MLKYFLLLSLAISLLNANEPMPQSALSYKDSIASLKSIERDGIFYGSGEQMVYVFLDPICPYSRKFISLVSKSETMLSKYRYCIYLYSIPRLHSTQTVAAVYDSKTPLDTLLKIMLDDAKLSTIMNEDIHKKIDKIEEVATKLNVKKRPFIVVEK